MASKHKSTPAWNPLHSGASSSSDSTPLSLRFRDDDGDDDDALDDDGDASTTDEMSTWHSTLCHSWQKGGVVLDIRVVTLRGRVSFWDHFVRGSVIILRDVVRVLCIFSFLFFLDTLILVHEVLWPFIVILTFSYILMMYVFLSLTRSCVVFFLSIYTCFLFICMQSYYSVSHKDALMSFV